MQHEHYIVPKLMFYFGFCSGWKITHVGGYYSILKIAYVLWELLFLWFLKCDSFNCLSLLELIENKNGLIMLFLCHFKAWKFGYTKLVVFFSIVPKFLNWLHQMSCSILVTKCLCFGVIGVERTDTSFTSVPSGDRSFFSSLSSLSVGGRHIMWWSWQFFCQSNCCRCHLLDLDMDDWGNQWRNMLVEGREQWQH